MTLPLLGCEEKVKATLQEHFTRLVEGAIRASLMHVRAFVHAYLSDRVSDAQQRIQASCRFIAVVILSCLLAKQDSRKSSL